MADAHKNLAASRVATAPSPATSGTSLVVDAGDGTRFPAVPFNASIAPDPTGLRPDQIADATEIVRVTAISTDTLTITRAQESTNARTVVIGDQIAATITAKTLTDAEDVAGITHAATSKTTPVDADEIPLVDSAASNVLKKLTFANLKASHGLVQLFDSTLGSSQANFDITSISAAYSHLMMFYAVRTDESAVLSHMTYKFNNDGGTNYDLQRCTFNNTTVALALATAQAGFVQFSYATAATADANQFGYGVLFMPNYAGGSAMFRSLFAFSLELSTPGTAGNNAMKLSAGSWRSTAAISRITLLPGGGTNFITGSRVTLYGLL